MLLKPFTAQINGAGQAVVTVSHSLHGIVWKVYQLGLGLNQTALLAQAAAHVNGIPLASTVQMQPSVFAGLSLLGQAPYAMESFFVGPPYIILQSGDMLVVGIVNATVGDTFTVGMYADERSANEPQSMGV